MTVRFCSNNLLRCLVAGFLLAAFGACSSKKEQLIREKVAERVNDFRKEETAKCRRELLIEAEHLVDSLLLVQALEEVNDSLKQRRSPKPLPPGILSPLDSLLVKPIFE